MTWTTRFGTVSPTQRMGTDPYVQPTKRTAYKKIWRSKPGISGMCAKGVHSHCYKVNCTCDCHPKVGM